MSTKKMLVSLSFGNYCTTKNEFLIPNIGCTNKVGFIGLKSGRDYPYGAVSYIGKRITTVDIVTKLREFDLVNSKEKDLVDLLNRYLEHLQNFKIGNVLEIKYTANDFILFKVAEQPPRKSQSKLP